MRALSFAVGLLILSAGWVPPAQAEGTPVSAPSLPDPKAHFRELCDKAHAAFVVGHYDQARGYLLQAWSLERTPSVALTLGQSEFELKRYRDAAEHLSFAIRNGEAVQDERLLARAKKNLAEAIAQVGVLHVTTNRADAEILVDGAVVGNSPLEQPLYLTPGVHEISARSSEGGTARPVSLEAGQESSLRLPIVAQAIHHETPWSSNAPRDSESLESRRTLVQSPQRSVAPVIVGGAVFLAGITTAIVFRLDSNAQFNTADSLRARLAATGCQGNPSTQGDCAALNTAARNGDHSRNWSTAGIAIAAGALLGTAAYWYWPQTGTKTSARNLIRVRLGGAILPQGSGFVLAGEY